MKRLLALLVIFLFVISFSEKSYASVNDYTSFARINVTDGKLLRDFTDKEKKEVLKKVNYRLFAGWNVKYINKNVPCEFIAKTLYSNYNTGTTPIKYSVEVQAENVVKTSVSVTDSIGVNFKGGIKELSGGLSNELKIAGEYQETALVKKKETINIEIDPNSMCIIYVMGRGLLTNGVAKHYALWIGDDFGCFEYFIITDCYVRIEKVSL